MPATLLFDPAFFDPALFDTVGFDSSDVDTALLATLQADPILRSWMPDGVFWDEAPAGKTRFVIVSLVDEFDTATFRAPGETKRTIEDALYLVKAVGFQTTDAIMRAAAERIDVVLEDAPLLLLDYTWMATFREERIRQTEVDESNPDLRWQHRGGRYRVQVSR